MLQSAAKNLKPEDVRSLGLDAVELQVRIEQAWQSNSQDHFQFVDMNLPIVDPELLRICLDICRERGLDWQSPSRMSDDMLIHKHTRRDRTEVIEERARQQIKRNGQGGTR